MIFTKKIITYSERFVKGEGVCYNYQDTKLLEKQRTLEKILFYSIIKL